jgi:DNA-binding PadR family transcriptional regulator
MTYNTALVLLVLRAGRRHGFELVAELRLSSGTVYPILRKLEEMGLLASEWEDATEAHRQGRPRRRYYELTRAGQARAVDAVETFQRHQRTFARLWPAANGRSEPR